MPKLIKQGEITDDRWTLVRDPVDVAALPSGPVIVPLALWIGAREALKQRPETAVWLGPADDPLLLTEDAAQLPLIAVDFPQFTDGRGYSSARLIRQRLAFSGELRAIGDVTRDQLYYLLQCGFDAFGVRAQDDPVELVKGFKDFSDGYQKTVQRAPYFQRRATAASQLASTGTER